MQDPSDREKEHKGGRGRDEGHIMIPVGDFFAVNGQVLPEDASFFEIGDQSPVSPDIFFININASIDQDAHISDEFPAQQDVLIFFIAADPAAQTFEEQGAVGRVDLVEDGEMGNIHDSGLRHREPPILIHDPLASLASIRTIVWMGTVCAKICLKLLHRSECGVFDIVCYLRVIL